MGISQMLMKLAEGMATSCWIFGITLLFFPATWYGHSVWTNVKKTYCSGDYKNLYFNHARHTADAAADGCLFRTVLSVRDQNFTVLPKHCGGDRFCA